MAFVAFLMHHLGSIDFSALYLIYDNHTAFEANAVATTLHTMTVPFTCKYWDKARQYQSSQVVVKRALTISFVSELNIVKMHETLDKTQSQLDMVGLVKNNKFIFVIPSDDTPPSQRFILRLILHVLLRRDGGLHFIAWPILRDTNKVPVVLRIHLPSRLTSVEALNGSFHWLAFRERVNRLPPGSRLQIIFAKANTLQMDVVQYQGRQLITGTFVGLCDIVANRIGSVGMDIKFTESKDDILT